MNIALLTIGAAMFLIGYIWIGIIAVRNDPSYGQWAFFSGLYRINYCKANWDKTKVPCLTGILGMVVILIGIVITMG